MRDFSYICTIKSMKTQDFTIQTYQLEKKFTGKITFKVPTEVTCYKHLNGDEWYKVVPKLRTKDGSILSLTILQITSGNMKTGFIYFPDFQSHYNREEGFYNKVNNEFLDGLQYQNLITITEDEFKDKVKDILEQFNEKFDV